MLQPIDPFKTIEEAESFYQEKLSYWHKRCDALKLQNERLREVASKIYIAYNGECTVQNAKYLAEGIKELKAIIDHQHKHSEPKCTCTVDFSPCYKCQIDAVNMQSAKTPDKP